MRVPTTTPRPTPARLLAGLTLAVGLVVGAVAATGGPATAGPAPAARSGAAVGPVLFLGDSVGASIQWSLQPLLRSGGYDVVYSAKSGRCTARTPGRCKKGDALEALAELDASYRPSLAVVELGYNDVPKSFGWAIDQLMKQLVARGVKKVVWINMSERRPDLVRGGAVYDDYNAILAAATKRWPQITVLDWNSASSGAARTGWFFAGYPGKPDLIHLTVTGQRQFAAWIRSELDRLRDAGALGGTPPTTVPSTTTKAGTTTPGSSAPGTTAAPTTGRPELQLGDRGPYVVELQQTLNRYGARIWADGVFGPGTERAVKAFQTAAGLRPDGKVGPKTWRALGFYR